VNKSRTLLLSIFAVANGLIAGGALAQDDAMSFFITSVGSGKGGDLGGLAGADAHCQALAQAAGAGAKTWRAYLSTSGGEGRQQVEARSRIGNGPWYNAKGVLIAADLTDLHINNNIRRETGLDENGNLVKARGDNPNQHDILTGSREDGTAFPPGEDRTCNNWTSSDEGSAMLGHFDRQGGGFTSWNAAHPSRGCSLDSLISTGGNGYLYCFAIN
jgi:hypothetical protein